jgi:hypothetical protein
VFRINEHFDAAGLRGCLLMNPSRSSVNTIGVHYLKIPVKLAS